MRLVEGSIQQNNLLLSELFSIKERKQAELIERKYYVLKNYLGKKGHYKF